MGVRAAGPRIAMLAFDFGYLCVPIANALSRHAEVMLVLPHAELEPVRDEVAAGVRVVTFHKPRLRHPRAQAIMARRVLATIREFAPDLVHLQQGHLWFNLALRFLRDIPLVVTIHDHQPHPGDRGGRKTPIAIMSLAFRRADQVIVHAEQLKREVVELRGLDPAAVHVVPHVAIGGPADPFAQADDGVTVLFFGRIWPYKGLDHLIRAQPMITERVPAARFVIAGEGEPFGRYREMMRDPSRFTVINEFVSNERRGSLFAEAAIVVLPYVEASQSGVVPLAYGFGKPVVATCVGGLPEAVDHEDTGLLVPPGNEQALADAIVRLLEDPDLRRAQGAAGLRKLRTEWSAERVAEQTLRVYEAALRRTLPAPEVA